MLLVDAGNFIAEGPEAEARQAGGTGRVGERALFAE